LVPTIALNVKVKAPTLPKVKVVVKPPSANVKVKGSAKAKAKGGFKIGN